MNIQEAFMKFKVDNIMRLADIDFYPIGETYGVIAYRYKRMDPPDHDLYYMPVRLEKYGLSDSTEITKDFDYAVIMAVAYSRGHQGYSPAVRRLLLE